MLVRSQPGAPKHASSGSRRFHRITVFPLAVTFRPIVGVAVFDRMHVRPGETHSLVRFDALEAHSKRKRRLKMSTETRNSRVVLRVAITG
ncbi:hypothetical protein [Burkholderia pyrrocinia]|uniref:hypothetical protein n=1 Tax=Burkholderia pyrrocinia TaxID=60550 RepID=UPI001ABB7CD0|nr:hypothetical protein [Burkholderia pyrrocinia]